MTRRRALAAGLTTLVVGVTTLLARRSGDPPQDAAEVPRIDAPGPAAPGDALLAAAPRPLVADPAVATARVVGRVTRDGKGVSARVLGWNLGRPADDVVAARAWGDEFRLRGMDLSEPDDLEGWLPEETRGGVGSRLAALESREAETKADADGSFSLPVVASDGHWLLHAESADGASGIAVSRGVAGSREDVEILLGVGAESLSVRAVDRRGSPFAGIVRLELASASGSITAIAGARRLDAAGRARFDHLLRRPHVAIVEWGEGSHWTSAPLDVPYGRERVLVVGVVGVVGVERRGLRGVVRGTDDAPIRGAVVVSSSNADGAQLTVRAVTGSDGAFVLASTGSEPSEVNASADGYEPASATPSTAGASVEFRLIAAARIRGRVVASATGAPVPGVRVVRARVSNRFAIFREDDFAFARSGPDGRFVLPADHGTEAIVVAYGAGWMSAELDGADGKGFRPRVVSTAQDGMLEVELRVVPAGRLEGTVVDADGRPAAHATVSLSQTDRLVGHCGNCYSRDPILPYLPDPEATTTDENGRFTFATVKPGVLHVIHAARGTSYVSEDVTLDDPGTTTITLTLPRPADANASPPSPVDVAVTENDGRTPIPGANVSLTPLGLSSLEAKSGPDGVARFEDVAGLGGAASVTAEGHAWGYRDGLPARAAPGLSRRTLAVSLSPTYEVRGRVVDPSGRPVVAATVSPWGPALGGSGKEAAWTASGGFVVRDVPAGTITLTATLRRDGRDYSGEASTTVPNGGLDVVVSLVEVRRESTIASVAASSPASIAVDPERVTVCVVGPDGAPAASGLYRSRQPEWAREYDTHLGFWRGSFTTDPGIFGTEIADVFDARSASGERLAPGSSRELTRADVGSTVEVRLERAVSVGGRVLDPTGDSVVGARVAAHVGGARRHRESHGALATATTDATGAFTIDGLGREAYELTVDVPPGFLTPEPTPCTGGGRDVTIALRPAVRPTITLVDEAGAPVANAIVEVGPPGSIPFVASFDRTIPRTGPRGRVTLDRLDRSATYDVVVEDERQPARFLSARREGWTPSDTTIIVVTPATVAGRIIGPDGGPILDAWLVVVPTETSPREEATHRVPVGSEGSFSIGDLVRGDLWVRYGVGAGGPQRVTRVTAPAKDVELVVDTGPTLVVRVEGMPEGATREIHASLTTWAPDWKTAEQTTRLSPGADGMLRFSGLVLDRRYTLYAEWRDGEKIGWLADFELGSSPLTVRMESGGRIRGALQYSSAREAEAGAIVELDGRGFRRLASAAKDGTFELDGIPPGRWHVTATSVATQDAAPGLPRPGTTWKPARAEAEASAGDVLSLTLETPPIAGPK